MEHIQSLLFPVDKWSITQARRWIEHNGFKFIKVHETENYLRFRQFDPDPSKKKYRTVKFGVDGILAVYQV